MPWPIFGSGRLKNAIGLKRPPHGLKSTFCTNFIESPLFSRIGANFSPVERFLDLKRWKMRFGQNVLGIPWKARFVQFSWKTYCFHVLSWISVPQNDFWFWNVEKCDLVNFRPAERFFRSETLRNAIWSKRPPHGLKSTFCTIFIHSLLFSRIGVNFSPAELFLVLKRWEMQFGEFPSRRTIFWFWNVEKCDLVKTSSAWPEKHVWFNFHRKPTVFTYWR